MPLKTCRPFSSRPSSSPLSTVTRGGWPSLVALAAAGRWSANETTRTAPATDRSNTPVEKKHRSAVATNGGEAQNGEIGLPLKSWSAFPKRGTLHSAALCAAPAQVSGLPNPFGYTFANGFRRKTEEFARVSASRSPAVTFSTPAFDCALHGILRWRAGPPRIR
jgi:hypothetical protein